MSLPDKFCKAPFTSAVVDKDGRLLPCCEYLDHLSDRPIYFLDQYDQWWNQGLDDLRTKMVTGSLDPGCSHCIGKEHNQSQVNLRRWTNQRIVDSSEQVAAQWQAGVKRHAELLEIRLGNLCNLACMMCNPASSSTLAAEYAQHRQTYKSIGINAPTLAGDKWWEDQSKWSRLKDLISRSRYLHFGGGEPFMHPRILDLLQVIPKDCKVSFNTNMTRLDDDIYEVLDSLPQASLVVSIEGAAQHNDYIRWPSKWHTIEQAFDRLGNRRISIHHVLQHTSVFALPDLVAWAEMRQVPMTFGQVYHGSVDGSGMMTIDSVAPADFERFSVWLADYKGRYHAVLTNWTKNYQYKEDLHQRFRQYVHMLDSIRGTDFTGTFRPSWAPARSN